MATSDKVLVKLHLFIRFDLIPCAKTVKSYHSNEVVHSEFHEEVGIRKEAPLKIT